MSDSAIVSELRRIAEVNGGELRPADVVEAARIETSPLHPQFDWDDTEAAQKWRLHQARRLIKVTVEYIGGDEVKIPARVFVSLTTDRHNGTGYRVLAAVMSNSEHRKQLMADALADMQRFEKKYSELKELTDVFMAMRNVKKVKSSLDDPMPWPADFSAVRPADALKRASV